MNVLLKSAIIVHAARPDLHLKTKDILIRNGSIEKIDETIEPSGTIKQITAENLHVSIGWFDSGICIGEPGYEERETITNALQCAAKSGFTDVMLNPSSFPVPDTSADIVFLKNAAKGYLTELHPMGSLTVNGDSKVLAELYDMKNAGALAFYDYKTPLANANMLKIALQYAQNFDGVVCSFPLDMSIAGKGVVNEGEISTKMGLKGIPALAEGLQVARDLAILEYTGGSLHIPTISTASAVQHIAAAKKKGLQVTCSVAVHNLFFNDTAIASFNTGFKTMPPLRTSQDSKALIKGVLNKTVDFVTTDHTPLNIELKQVEFDYAAYGSLGLESAFGALRQLFSVEDTIALLTKGRDIFGIATPDIAEGEPAALTLFEPDTDFVFAENNVYSASKNSMFLTATLKGKVLGTIARNKMILNT